MSYSPCDFVDSCAIRAAANGLRYEPLEDLATDVCAAIEQTAAARAALVHLKAIVKQSKPSEEPEEEDYDDTESAHTNGYESAAWLICSELETLIRQLEAATFKTA